ncbi:MAG TPA: HEAT repeat domain-containing protein [Pyrinomonadaceae bacterium]|nr:HEAT repeat domain-containing protein [Pyrinomonadaceae bacterium]
MDVGSNNQNLIGIFTTDAKFTVQVWDAALARMTGISAEIVINKPVNEIIPDLAERGLWSRFERVLETGTVEILAPSFHKFLISCPPQFSSKHFTEMRQRVTIAPLKADDTIHGLIVTIEDVTERMEREIEIVKQLTDSDDQVRLRAAKAISNDSENLNEKNAEPIINALGDKNWRVRRELVEGFSRRAAPDAIGALLQAMKEKHFDFGVLNSALQILQSTSVKTIETLIEFLQDNDADLRMQVALILGEQKYQQAIPALLNALEDEDENVRFHVIEALAKMKTEEAVEPILAIAEKRDFFLSFAALEALREIADDSITERLFPLLNDDFLREATIETLGAVGNAEVVSVLIDLLNNDRSSVISVAKAFKSLSENNGVEIIKPTPQSISDSGKENLLYSLNTESGTDLKAIIYLAGFVESEKIRQRLGSLLENENFREDAAEALGQQGELAIDLLIERLQTEDLKVGQTAVRLLGKIKSERVVSVLIEVLKANSELSSEAALALGQIGDQQAFEPLINLLKNGNTASRQAAGNALKHLAHPDTVKVLDELITDSEPTIRIEAIKVVGHFGAKGCENKIVQSCEDKDERVQKAALEQLPNIVDDRKNFILAKLLKEGSPRLRAEVVQILSRIKNQQSLIGLREALDDADAWVRYFAVRALGKLNDLTISEKLFEMAKNDEAEQVRLAAYEVLGELEA